LPPDEVVNELARRVSPGEGSRGVRALRSLFREPMTVMRVFGDILVRNFLDVFRKCFLLNYSGKTMEEYVDVRGSVLLYDIALILIEVWMS
jgi:hypothetical protein